MFGQSSVEPQAVRRVTDSAELRRTTREQHHCRPVWRVSEPLGNRQEKSRVARDLSTLMEKVPLNNLQLDHLATADAILKPYFYGTVACDRLPRRPIKKEPRGYIVNTDPHDRQG